jgi:hypothetical protein
MLGNRRNQAVNSIRKDLVAHDENKKFEPTLIVILRIGIN